MIVISKYIVPRGYAGLTIFPFVFLKFNRFKTDYVLINHEKIHLKQQLDMLIILFYLIYAFEFLIRLIQFRKWEAAYRNISFEKEAYCNEKNLDYIKHQPFWGFLKYLCTNDF